jgi:hypothetical protein
VDKKMDSLANMLYTTLRNLRLLLFGIIQIDISKDLGPGINMQIRYGV